MKAERRDFTKPAIGRTARTETKSGHATEQFVETLSETGKSGRRSIGTRPEQVSGRVSPSGAAVVGVLRPSGDGELVLPADQLVETAGFA